MPLTGGTGRPPPDVVPGVHEKIAQEEAPERGPVIATKFVIVPLGLALSCIAHVVLLTPAVYFAGANAFNPAPADAITVDIVSPEEAGEAEKPQAAGGEAEKPQVAGGDMAPSLTLSPQFSSGAKTVDMNAGDARTATAMPPAAPRPESKQPQSSPAERPLQQSAAQAAAQAQPANPGLSPAWLPQQFGQSSEAEPVPPPAPSGETDMSNVFAMPLILPNGQVGGKYDSQAVDRADISNDSAAAFRSHLKTCSALPPGVAPEVKVVLRVYLKPDGSLAGGLPQNPEPIKVEGVSVGGGALFQRAVAALRKCQPFKMLPPDKYDEWKRLDLTFTPQNF